MANATVSRLGQINGAGDVQALFLKQFAGEVLTAFETNVIMADKHMTRAISSGKSAQFPKTWKIGSEYHVPGAEINGTAVKHGEKVITIDDLLIAHAFIANIDDAMNHYDVRSIYTTEMGRELAKTYDKNVMREIIAASRAAHDFDANYNGVQEQQANFASDGAVIATSIFNAAEKLDSRDVPDADRYGVFAVAQYYLLAQQTALLDRDFGNTGSYEQARIPMVAGVPIFKSNNVPQDDNSAGSFHAINCATTVGAVFHKSAAGTVKLMDLALESEYDIRRQGTLMVGKYAVGHGLLRPEAAIEFRTGVPV